MALVAGAFIAPGPAAAQLVRGFVTGDLISVWCSREEPVDVEACLSYLRGASDALNAMQFEAEELGEEESLPSPVRCVPERVSINELKTVVGRYLEEHPEMRRLQAGVVVMHALREAFPC